MLLHVVYLDEATSGTMPKALTPEEQASLMLVRITVSPQNRQTDDVLAQAFGRALIPLKGQSLYEQFRDFFVNLYVNKYNHLSFEEVSAMISSTEIFDDIGKSLAVRQYAEEQVQKGKDRKRPSDARCWHPVGASSLYFASVRRTDNSSTSVRFVEIIFCMLAVDFCVLGWSITFWVVMSDNACSMLGKGVDL